MSSPVSIEPAQLRFAANVLARRTTKCAHLGQIHGVDSSSLSPEYHDALDTDGLSAATEDPPVHS